MTYLNLRKTNSLRFLELQSFLRITLSKRFRMLEPFLLIAYSSGSLSPTWGMRQRFCLRERSKRSRLLRGLLAKNFHEYGGSARLSQKASQNGLKVPETGRS